jgi:hypothetical protein
MDVSNVSRYIPINDMFYGTDGVDGKAPSVTNTRQEFTPEKIEKGRDPITYESWTRTTPYGLDVDT